MLADAQINAELERLKAVCAVLTFLVSSMWGTSKPQDVDAMIERMRDHWLMSDLSDEAREHALLRLRQFFEAR